MILGERQSPASVGFNAFPEKNVRTDGRAIAIISQPATPPDCQALLPANSSAIP